MAGQITALLISSKARLAAWQTLSDADTPGEKNGIGSPDSA